MSDEILETVAANISEVNRQIERAQNLINAAKEAGENVIELEQRLQDARLKKVKWENMLKARGINV